MYSTEIVWQQGGIQIQVTHSRWKIFYGRRWNGPLAPEEVMAECFANTREPFCRAYLRARYGKRPERVRVAGKRDLG